MEVHDAHGALRPSSSSPLLEREGELAFFAAVARAAAAGEPRVALIEGQAGIGKTRLLAEARARASEASVRVLTARGGELEREYAFGIVRQLFEPTLTVNGGRDRFLRGAAEAGRPVFELSHGPTSSETEAAGSFAALHGLYWLAVNLSSESPLLLAVDDLHWCDHPSLRFLAYPVRRLEGLPISVACTLRPAEPGVDTVLLGEIAADPLTVSVQPRSLSPAAVEELVGARLGADVEPEFAGACHESTGGNPLLLTELLRALDAEDVRPDEAHVPVVRDLGPRAVSRAVLLRLARLSEDAASVARAVSVLGDGAELGAAAALAGLDEQRAAAATAALARAEILRPELPLGFVHPLVGDAVYHDVPPLEREQQHARAARLLVAAAAPDEQVAAHLLLIPPQGEAWAVDTLRRAAADASGKGATESAVSYLQRALAEAPPELTRAQVLFELGAAEAMTSGPAAAEHLREAYETFADPALRGAVARILALTLLQTGEREEGAAVARRAAAELPAELDDLREALEAFALATVLFGVGEPAQFRALEAHRDRAELPGPGAKMLAGLAAHVWAYADGSRDDCVALARSALAGGDLIEADNGFLSIAPIAVLEAAEADAAVLEAWEASLVDAHRRGSLYAVSSIHLWHGYGLLRRGDLEEAQRELEQAAEEFRDWGFSGLARFYLSAFLTTANVGRGDLAAARRAADEGPDPGLTADGIRYWLNSRLELEVAEGRDEEAVATADELARRFPHVVNPAFGPWRSLKARALDRLGRRDQAVELAREELELARMWGAPGPIGRALRVLGTIERDEDLLEQAVEVLAGSTARLEHARALAAYGSARRRARRPTEAREPLRQALELADVCGADGLVAEIRTELYASGARPRTTALQGVESLTASERRVAQLAAEGQTNRDIAQGLFVTPKTVEVHLSNAYRKLGIRSRRELAAALRS